MPLTQATKDMRKRTRNAGRIDQFGYDEVEDAQEALIKAKEVEHTFGIVDRALSPDLDDIHVVHIPQAPPGWTDGIQLYLNSAELPELGRVIDKMDLAVWLGANAHEVGHSLFSPQFTSTLMDTVIELDNTFEPGLKNVENLVEDQRMERLVIGRFGPWGTYLTATAIRLAVIEPLESKAVETEGHLWPWVVGRTWLPADMRKRIHDGYPGDADRLARNVGAYQRLADPGEAQADEALNLLRSIREQLIEDGIILPNQRDQLTGGCDPLGEKPSPDTSVDDDTEVSDDNVPSAGSEQDDEQLEEAGDQDGDEPGGSGEPEGDCDGPGGQPGEGVGQDGEGKSGDDGAGTKGSGDAEGSGDGQDDAGDGEGGTETTSSGGGAGKGGGKLSTQRDRDKLAKQLSQQLNDAIGQQMRENGDVKTELDNLKAALDDELPDSTSLKQYGEDMFDKTMSMPVRGEVAFNGHHMSKEFAKLIEQAEAGWVQRTEHGRLNIDRYIDEITSGNPDFDVVFDTWKPGAEDEVSLDVTILLDISGSMTPSVERGDKKLSFPQGLIQPASEAVWQIRRAVRRANGDCTVIAYNNQSFMLFDRDDRVPADIVERPRAGGGTDPSQGIADTWRRLRTVDAHNKLVIVVTDGQWTGRSWDAERGHYMYEAGKLIESMRAEGVVVVGVMLDPYLTCPYYADYTGFQSGDADKVAKWNKSLESQRKKSDENLQAMGVDADLSFIYEDPTDMVEQFRTVAKGIMTDAMLNAGVSV